MQYLEKRSRRRDVKTENCLCDNDSGTGRDDLHRLTTTPLADTLRLLEVSRSFNSDRASASLRLSDWLYSSFALISSVNAVGRKVGTIQARLPTVFTPSGRHVAERFLKATGTLVSEQDVKRSVAVL